jgi:hypothetical protein
MISTSSAWNSANAAPSKTPIYAFSISSVSPIYTTHDLARMGVTGHPSYAPWLKTPQGGSQSIDVINGTSSIGELQCEVVDHGGAVREVVGVGTAADTLCGSTATLLVGYPGLAWSQFVPLHTYILYKVNPTKGYGSYLFVCRDQQYLEKKTVYVHPENNDLISAENPWCLAGTPGEIFQAIVLFALGLAPSQVDLATLQDLDSAVENLFCAGRPFLFQIAEAFEAKQWLSTEIFKPCLIYPVVTNAGQLSLRAGRPPAAGPSAVFGFTQDNLVVLPELDRLPIVNEAIYQWDYDESEYQTECDFLQATSIELFDRGNQYNVQSKGLRTGLGGHWFAEYTTQRLFSRFSGIAGAPSGPGAGAPGLGGGAPQVSVEAMLMSLPIWVGDYITVSHPLMPNVLTGALGVTDRLYEVIDRQPDYARGRMKFKLLDTGLTGQAAAYQWDPSSARPWLVGSSPVY